jgi:hypothetical protein
MVIKNKNFNQGKSDNKQRKLIIFYISARTAGCNKNNQLCGFCEVIFSKNTSSEREVR